MTYLTKVINNIWFISYLTILLYLSNKAIHLYKFFEQRMRKQNRGL